MFGFAPSLAPQPATHRSPQIPGRVLREGGGEAGKQESTAFLVCPPGRGQEAAKRGAAYFLNLASLLAEHNIAMGNFPGQLNHYIRTRLPVPRRRPALESAVRVPRRLGIPASLGQPWRPAPARIWNVKHVALVGSFYLRLSPA